jgi:hypothetical protein
MLERDKIYLRLNINSSIVLFILLLLSVSSCNNFNANIDIIGRWEGIYNDNELSFVFNNDNTCVLKYYNKKSNKLETIKGNYELDISKKPISLSIRNIPQLNHPLYSIIEFNGNNFIKIAEFSPKWRLRPIAFDSEKSINLKRVLLIKKKKEK